MEGTDPDAYLFRAFQLICLRNLIFRCPDETNLCDINRKLVEGRNEMSLNQSSRVPIKSRHRACQLIGLGSTEELDVHI